MREVPIKTQDAHREAKSQRALLNRWGRVHDEPAQQKSSVLAPDTRGTPTAASPLVRERERGFHRWLDSNLLRRAVLLINLSSAMRLRSHRCVTSFIQREQPEKDHGSYALHGCQRPGWRGSREHQWGGGVLCLLHAAPLGSCYLHTAHEALESRGCPTCLCQAKLSITSIFQALYDRSCCWMLHSNKALTGFFFLILCKEGFKIQAAHAPEGRENWSASMICCKLLLPQFCIKSLFSPSFFS